MSRWSYDLIFLRVICISLIAIAFIFGVILTNVFVDIDGFLVSKMLNKDVDKVTESEAKDYQYEEYSTPGTVYRFKRSSDPLQSSFKSIYKDNNNLYNMEISPGDSSDAGQLNNLGMIMQFLHNNKTDPQTYQTLSMITNLLQSLFKLRPKRQANLDGMTEKSNASNSGVEENRHIDIEIKTHFDSKTTNSGRKQFITRLIDKIRRALRSDTEVVSNQIDNEPNFKTREQEPIVITKNIRLDSINIPQFDDDRRMGKHKRNQYKKPRFKNVKAEQGNKYVEDFQNSFERRFQKPIADNADSVDLFPDYNSLSFLLNNVELTGVSTDYDQYTDDPNTQKWPSEIKVYHNVIA